VIASETWTHDPVTDLRIVSEKNPGQTYARKKGVAESRYDIITFIDDDNRVNENWISRVHYNLHEKNYDACGGRNFAAFEGTEPGWFSHYQNCFAVGKQGEYSGKVSASRGFLWGAGFSIRKKVWEKIYSENFPAIQSGRKGKNLSAGEDSEFGLALTIKGYSQYYDEEMTLVHFMPSSRMKDEQLLRLMDGMGRDEVVLSMYRTFALKGFRMKSSWWLEALAYSKRLAVFMLKNPGSVVSADIRTKADLTYRKAYLKELFLRRKEFKTLFNTVKDFATSNQNSTH
jgi:glycosyltransferase involved in cell wall biosynthesis